MIGIIITYYYSLSLFNTLNVYVNIHIVDISKRAPKADVNTLFIYSISLILLGRYCRFETSAIKQKTKLGICGNKAVMKITLVLIPANHLKGLNPGK